MADPAASPPPAAPRDSRSSRLKQALVAVALMLVVGVLFFFIGRIQGRAPIPELEARAAAAEAQLAAVQDRALLYESLALTYRAALDLDARNFGTANDRLDAAARSLNGLSGVDGTAVDELRSALAQTDLTVAADLAQQRAQVLLFAEEIASLLQERPPEGAPLEVE